MIKEQRLVGGLEPDVGLGRHCSAADRVKRWLDDESELVDRNETLLPDQQSAELAAAARRNVLTALNTLPFEYINETLGLHPERMVDKISPRRLPSIATDNDRLMSLDESPALYEKVGEPKKVTVRNGYGHYEVYAEPAVSAR